ncbi:MAG: KTSC domain-containing protein [Planctomycetes bacterium]|nr:KTSC domain-containing protein [Planctomycetota bacterium]
MPQIAEYLLILGIDSCESETQLKAAYRREMKRWHPDLFHKNPEMLSTATDRARKINDAFEHLSELLEIGPLPNETVRANTPPASKPQQEYRTQHTYNRRPFKTGFPNPNVFEVFVKSSHIISIGYSRANRTLYIKFDGGSVYGYLNVPESMFSDFIEAESHGKFAHRNIYSQYKYVSY